MCSLLPPFALASNSRWKRRLNRSHSRVLRLSFQLWIRTAESGLGNCISTSISRIGWHSHRPGITWQSLPQSILLVISRVFFWGGAQSYVPRDRTYKMNNTISHLGKFAAMRFSWRNKRERVRSVVAEVCMIRQSCWDCWTGWNLWPFWNLVRSTTAVQMLCFPLLLFLYFGSGN